MFNRRRLSEMDADELGALAEEVRGELDERDSALLNFDFEAARRRRERQRAAEIEQFEQFGG